MLAIACKKGTGFNWLNDCRILSFHPYIQLGYLFDVKTKRNINDKTYIMHLENR